MNGYQDVIKHCRTRQGKGQSVMEYAGALVVAAFLVVAVVSNLVTDEASFIRTSYNTVYSTAAKVLDISSYGFGGNSESNIRGNWHKMAR